MTMTGNSELTDLSPFSDSECSTLITISTPDSAAPICRLGNCKEILGTLSVRQLIERVVSPNSLLSVHVPMSQLEAEAPTALAVSGLLQTGCEVLFEGNGNGGSRLVSLDEPAVGITEAQVGAQGSSFLNISLEIRPQSGGVVAPGVPADDIAVDGIGAGDIAPDVAVTDAVSAYSVLTPDEHREIAQSDLLAIEAKVPEPVEPVAAAPEERRQIALPQVVEATPEPVVSVDEAIPVQDVTQPMPAGKIEELFGQSEEETASEVVTSAAGPPSPAIVAIVAKPAPRQPRSSATADARKEYIRKSDWLRAQFLPEVQALDFSGLFVGNLGMGVREEQGRRQVVLADPARITDILLRGNSYRRTGDHAKALICYQELVDMDPGNADFRFLLGKTLIELGQHQQGVDALTRAKELGHEGARKELETVKVAVPRSRSPLGFLRFWKQ